MLPWPLPKIPAYRAGSVGKWRCRPTPKMDHLTTGYFLAHKVQAPGWMFTRSGTIWMSLTKMEIESQMHHIAAAHGHTVIAGLGMGFVLFNILAKPEVTKVTLLEIDPEVVALMDRVTDWRKWPGVEKLTIVMGDATEWETGQAVDFLYADIWEHLGWSQAVPTTRAIQYNTGAKLVGWWGQEFDFIDWGRVHHIRPSDLTRTHYRMFARDVMMPMIEQDSPRYPKWAAAAVVIQMAGREQGPNKAMLQLLAAQLIEVAAGPDALDRALGAPV